MLNLNLYMCVHKRDLQILQPFVTCMAFICLCTENVMLSLLCYLREAVDFFFDLLRAPLALQ